MELRAIERETIWQDQGLSPRKSQTNERASFQGIIMDKSEETAVYRDRKIRQCQCQSPEHAFLHQRTDK